MKEQYQIVRKTIAREDWRRILRRKSVFGAVACGDFYAQAGLMRIDAVSAPFCRPFAGKMRTLADAGYYWLQVAPEKAHWWLTVMFDPQGKIVQGYFDITKENHLLPDGQAWFEDLFLDVVFVPGEGAVVLDEDELAQALAQGVIDEALAGIAGDALAELLDGLSERETELIDFLYALFAQYQIKLEENEDGGA